MKKFVMNESGVVLISAVDFEAANLNEWERLELLCNLMKGEIRPEVSIPPEVLEEAGADPDCKLACEVDLESGAIHVVEADYRYDLTDVPSTLLDTFRECGICLNDLEEKLKGEVVVYGAEADESFSD